MRWWLNTDHGAFSVDNAIVQSGMNFSSLPPDLWMIHWTDGIGEIEYQDPSGINPNGVPGINLNGLRDKFYDVTPYAPLFQQFLSLLPDVTLAQAQQVQIDLIKQLFESKRQVPFHHAVGAGDYWWDADDSSVTAMACAVMPNLISSIFTLGDSSGGTTTSLVAQLNANYTTWYNQLNSNYTTWRTQIDQNVSAFNQTAAEINSWVVDQVNGGFYDFNSHIGSYGGVGDTTNTINNRLNENQSPIGLIGNLSTTAHVATHVDQTFGNVSALSVSALSVSAGTIGSGALAIQWLPWGRSVDVSITGAEVSAIMSGIASLRLSLQKVMNSKINAVAALTTVASVIAYDVSAGWPAISAPPGYPFGGMYPAGGGASLTVISQAPTGGGIGEAPIDGLMYGRQSAAWQRALAITGDLLDGGTF